MSQDSAAEHNADTGPLTLPPVAPAALPRARPPIWRWAAIGALVALAIGAILYATWPADPLSDPRPVEVVRGFVAAVEAKDPSKMLSYAVPTERKREIGPEVRAYLEYVEAISFSDARYTLLDNDGERAHVRWTATMHYRLNLGSQVKSGDKPVDTVYELIKIEGAWYLSSAAPPGP